MKIKSFFFFLISIFSLNACETATDPISPGESKGQSGYLVGRVTNQSGQGVAGAVVFTESTVFKGRGAEVKTDANGNYKVAIPDGLGQWIVGGYTLPELNGRVYKMKLHPDIDESFAVEDKPVRNFIWKIQGRYQDKSLQLYYGGSAELYRDANSELRDTENIEFTFVPEGKLIDGSTGKTLKLSCGKSGANHYNRIDDIPIGRYRVSAIYKPTGQTLKVGDAWDGEYYEDEVTMEFKGTETSYRQNQMGLAFTDL